MIASEPNTYTPCTEEEERINNQLVATIARYMQCFDYISTEIRTEECSCCEYRQIVKEIEQAEGIDELCILFGSRFIDNGAKEENVQEITV